MKNQVKKFDELVSSLEQVSEDQYGMLIGGFATVSSDSTELTGKGGTNILSCDSNTNCSGGNCVAGCGKA